MDRDAHRSFDDDEDMDDERLRFVPEEGCEASMSNAADTDGEDEDDDDEDSLFNIRARPNYLCTTYNRRVSTHVACVQLRRTSFSLRTAPETVEELTKPVGSVSMVGRLGKGSSDVNGEVTQVSLVNMKHDLALKVMPLRASHRRFAQRRLHKEALHLDTWIEVNCIQMAQDLMRHNVCPHFPIVARFHVLADYLFSNPRILRRPMSAYHGRRWAEDLSMGSEDMDRIADEVAHAIYDDRRAEEGTVSEAPESDPLGMSPQRLFRKALRVSDAMNEPLLESRAGIPALLLWMELWGGDMEVFLRDARPVSAVVSVLFQVCTAVHAFQTYYDVTLYDQHLGNVLVSRVDAGGYWSHTIGDVTYHAPNVGYVAAIWDYSYAGTGDGRMSRLGSVRKNQLRKVKKLGAPAYVDMYRVLNVALRRLKAWRSLPHWSPDLEFEQLVSMIQKTRNSPDRCCPKAMLRTWFGKGAPYSMVREPEHEPCLDRFNQNKRLSRKISDVTEAFLTEERALI